MKIPRNALKTLCCVLVLPILIAALSVPVLGVEKLTFKDTANTNGLFDDGGYYILDGTEITVTATEANGIEIEGNGYCTWAFYRDVVANYPYLVYTISDDTSNALQQMQATSYYAGGYLIDIPSDPGTHVINLIEHFADQASVTLGYYYVIVFASGYGKTFVDEIYLSSADPTQGTDSPAGELVEEGGELYYREGGVGVMAGLVKVGDDYYFAGWNGRIVKNKLQNIWANATGEAAFDGKNRVFGADGKMASGLVTVGDDVYYCVDGKPTMAGLVKDGDDVYFIGGEGKAVKNKLQNIWKNDSGDASFTGKNRAFGADGKLLTGILNDVYYKDGVATMAGLVEVDGDLYFASGAGQIVKNKTQYIWANSTGNADLTGTSQTFGADGKLAA